MVVATIPACAGSVETDAYIATVSQDLDILRQSSAIAEQRAVTADLRVYAQGELVVPLLQTMASASGVPAIIAGNMVEAPTDRDDVLTARSVHIDQVDDLSTYRAPLGTGVQMPTAAEVCSYLESADAAAFDRAYKATQETALTALRAAETAYARTGDDPALRAGAIAQLPKIDARLAALRAL